MRFGKYDIGWLFLCLAVTGLLFLLFDWGMNEHVRYVGLGLTLVSLCLGIKKKKD